MTHDDSPTSPFDPAPVGLPPAGTASGPAPATPPPPPGEFTPPTPGATPPPGASPAFAAAPPAAGTVPPAGASPSSSGPVPPPMTASRAQNQPGLVFGILLLLVGGLLLVTRVTDIKFGEAAWPLWIVVPGIAMLVGSFFIPARNGLGLAIPGAIVTIVGLVLWAQETFDAYQTWAYAWALVAPTGPGLGTLLYGVARGDRELVGDGLRMTAIGLALFAGFALFFEGVIGLSGEPIANVDEVLPYGVIGLGLLLVVLSLFGGAGSARRQARHEAREARRAERRAR